MFQRQLCLWFAGLTGVFAAPPPQGQPTPLYRITIERTVQAVNYRPTGATYIDFQGTPLAPGPKGIARVSTERGAVKIDAKFENLSPPATFGPEFLTYVLWAITPEGRARNLGEIVLNGHKSQAKVTTSLQAFGMIITAEPYFAVSVPSDVVVVENVLRKNTRGSTATIDAKSEFLQRGDYEKAGLRPTTLNPKVPLDLYQARNAVQVAKSAEAEQYSADSLAKAETALLNAESFQSKGERKLVITFARQAVQAAEDARLIATQRSAEELAARLRAEAADREAREKQAAASANARAELEAQQKRQAEAAAALAKAEADRQAQQKRDADLAAARAEQARLRAELQGQQARQEAERQRKEREAADLARRRAEDEKRELRAGLLKQFNSILETRDTTRGLVVNMGDVLFDTGKFNLRPTAREALAKLSGIVLSHPGLRLEIEGHTDSVGSDEFNQELSQKRAESVQGYLLAQHIPENAITAIGLGKTSPVASNDTSQGRQRNRRVEIVVSGEVIGVDISSTTTREH